MEFSKDIVHRNPEFTIISIVNQTLNKNTFPNKEMSVEFRYTLMQTEFNWLLNIKV